MLALHRIPLGKRCAIPISLPIITQKTLLHTSSSSRDATNTTSDKTTEAQDPRITSSEKVDDLLIEDKFALLKSTYQPPKNPIILAHGLLGFDELHLVPGKLLPGIEYWYGITQALAAKNIEVITAAVPPSGSIENRAQKLAEVIERKAGGKAVNIIA